jgi:aminoglycoside phosphotransferase (APT) family kinase protein
VTGDRGLDEARPVRPGEELDAARLAAFLGERGLAQAGPVTVEQFPGGYSNLTYLVRSGGREWVLRRPPAGAAVRGGHDMLREHRLLSRLAPVYAKAPRPIAACEDPSVLGAPFYLMERVRGVILRRHRVLARPVDVAALSAALVDTLCELHAVDVTAAGLADLGKPQGYGERQVRGWTERWNASRTGEVPAVEGAARWLNEQAWPDAPAALVHNDFKYDNVVLDPDDLGRVVAVLDWEMATLGDPLTDVGLLLMYWRLNIEMGGVEAFGNATPLPGAPTGADLAAMYASKRGIDLASLDWYLAFANYKLAVIAEGIHFRYQAGQTVGDGFATLGAMVPLLVTQGHAALRGEF